MERIHYGRASDIVRFSWVAMKMRLKCTYLGQLKWKFIESGLDAESRELSWKIKQMITTFLTHVRVLAFRFNHYLLSDSV